MYANKKELRAILPELEIIQMDTGLQIKRAKDLKVILAIYNRQMEEFDGQRPGKMVVERKNRLSLYFTMHCYHRVNKFN